MRISLYSFFLFALLVTPALAQQDYRPQMPVNKYFYQCAARMGPSVLDKDPGFKSKQGYVGLFLFSVNDAYEAGLCSTPVPIMPQEQIWKFCDFKGPIAQKYNINTLFDLRYDPKASPAQFEMMQNLVKKYDDYIYQKKYDQFFGKYINGIPINADMIRGLLLSKGRAAVDDYLHGKEIHDQYNQGIYATGTCLHQCMASKGKDWFCR